MRPGKVLRYGKMNFNTDRITTVENKKIRVACVLSVDTDLKSSDDAFASSALIGIILSLVSHVRLSLTS